MATRMSQPRTAPRIVHSGDVPPHSEIGRAPGETAGPAASLGLASAMLATALTVVFVALAVVLPGEEWSGIEAYASTFRTAAVAQLVPVLLLAPVVVVLVASIHATAPDEEQVFTLIALVFAAVYAATISVNYAMQLFVVRLNILAGDLEGLAILAMPNRRSIFVALEAVGYGFFGLMALATAFVFAGTRLHSWIRVMYLVTGATGVVGMVGAIADQPVLMLTGFGLSLLAFLAAAILTSIHFGRLRRT
jgi:hypothetical protein